MKTFTFRLSRVIMKLLITTFLLIFISFGSNASTSQFPYECNIIKKSIEDTVKYYQKRLKEIGDYGLGRDNQIYDGLSSLSNTYKNLGCDD